MSVAASPRRLFDAMAAHDSASPSQLRASSRALEAAFWHWRRSVQIFATARWAHKHAAFYRLRAAALQRAFLLSSLPAPADARRVLLLSRWRRRAVAAPWTLVLRSRELGERSRKRGALRRARRHAAAAAALDALGERALDHWRARRFEALRAACAACAEARRWRAWADRLGVPRRMLRGSPLAASGRPAPPAVRRAFGKWAGRLQKQRRWATRDAAAAVGVAGARPARHWLGLGPSSLPPSPGPLEALRATSSLGPSPSPPYDDRSLASAAPTGFFAAAPAAAGRRRRSRRGA